MAEFVRLTAEHVRAIRLQAAQAFMAPLLVDDEYCSAVEAAGGLAMVAPDGRVLGCGGVVPIWRGRGFAWTLIAEGLPPTLWTAAARRMAAEICTAHDRGLRRIEATVKADFAAGRRLVAMMGFHCEGMMEAYDPWGNDHILYARVA